MSDLYRRFCAFGHDGECHPVYRPVEPVGILASTVGGTGRITYTVDTDGLGTLPPGKYMIVEADDE